MDAVENSKYAAAAENHLFDVHQLRIVGKESEQLEMIYQRHSC